ncbi:MAG TPA: hypothetical protein VND87_00005 [Stellaceae bacterium]|jgi:hypothetical protein|nr:hypothetical protein [Stellaceae bacterium]
MSTRSDRPRAYFARLLDQPDDQIDYSEIPATTAADWQDAEVLLPVTPEEFRAIKRFVEARRRQEDTAARPHGPAAK